MQEKDRKEIHQALAQMYKLRSSIGDVFKIYANEIQNLKNKLNIIEDITNQHERMVSEFNDKLNLIAVDLYKLAKGQEITFNQMQEEQKKQEE